LETAVHFGESKFELPHMPVVDAHVQKFGAAHVTEPAPLPADFDDVIKKRAEKRRSLHDEMITKVLGMIRESQNGHWRFQMISGHFLGMLAREDVHVRRDTIAYFLEGAVSEILPLRQAAVATLVRFMYNIKRRSLNQAGTDGAYKRVVDDNAEPVASYVAQLGIRDLSEQEFEQR
jgi:hypothetical protein